VYGKGILDHRCQKSVLENGPTVANSPDQYIQCRFRLAI
jgi:hypothetical protein